MKPNSFPYQVIGEFVRGGCSIIYKLKGDVEPGVTEKQFVLKAMNLAEEDPQSNQRFYMEYEFLRAYPHPNLVEVKEYFPDWKGRPAYVMEWVEGATWQQHWGDRKGIDHLREFLNLFGQLCEVVDFIHKHQIIHRDLKPQNILISMNEVLKLIDFGIMKVADLTLYTHRNTFMGSAYYVSPEGISGETVSHTADIFALGVMLYDLFTGLKPFKGPTLGETIYQRLVKKPQPPSQIAELPEALDAIILKMLERNPRDRYQDCAEIFKDLNKVLSGYFPDPVKEDNQPVDVLTKGPLLHQPFIKKCQGRLTETRFLFLQGESGSGKTTIVENIANQMSGIESLRLDCQSETTELDFMQVILTHLGGEVPHRADLAPWFEIIANALPQLRWPSSGQLQKLSHSTILSAFYRILFAIESPVLLIIEELHDANDALRQFVLQMAQHSKGPNNTAIHLLLTTGSAVEGLASLGAPWMVPYPDPLVLTEFLISNFPDSRIPLDITETLSRAADDNLGEFIHLIKENIESGKLKVENGIVNLDIDPDSLPSQPQEAIEADLLANPLPVELMNFADEQMDQLKWIALCPDGLDLNLLKVLTEKDMDALGKTIEEAEKHHFLEFQSSSTMGFRWKNTSVREFIIGLIPKEEQSRKVVKLAKTIEDQSAQYLPHSPPLWLILAKLYLQAEIPVKASEYAFTYARYCFQNDNYRPIREFLTQFSETPSFSENVDFWCMLALANAENDLNAALQYGRKALAIKESIQTLSLMAILEFFAGAEAKAGHHLDDVFKKGDFQALDIHLTAKLLPITLALGRSEDANTLYEKLVAKLHGRTDLFAVNTKLLARMELLRPSPRELLNAKIKLKQELLPQTQVKIQRWAALSYQELFQYQHALSEIQAFDQPGRSQILFFQEMFFLNLNFNKFGAIKTLIAKLKRDRLNDTALKVLDPLCQLVTEMVIQDPKILDGDHIFKLLSDAGLCNSEWLALVASFLDPDTMKPEFLERVVDKLKRAASPWAYHQLGRLEILSMLHDGQNAPLEYLFQSAIAHCQECDLVMEALRLEGLRVNLEKRTLLPESLQSSIPPSWLESTEAVQFLHKVTKV